MLIGPFEVLLALLQPGWAPSGAHLKALSCPFLCLCLCIEENLSQISFHFTVTYCFCGALNERNTFEHLCVRRDSVLENIVRSLGTFLVRI